MAACFAGIEKYLARAAAAEKIQHLMANHLIHENNQNVCDPNSSVNINCEQTICDFIQTCVSLKVAYIIRATGPWGSEHWFNANNPYIQSLPQFVTEVNNAYDCAGLRRPLIQANIFENVDANNLRPWPGSGIYLIETVQIEHDVLREFFDDMTSIEKNRYFFNGNINNPRNINFTFENVTWRPISIEASPDVHKIEGRMWLFQCAKIFIDAGYTSLHMGQAHLWGRVGYDNGKQNLGGDLKEVTKLIGRIRAYAHSLPGKLINFPSGYDNVGIEVV